MIGTDINKKTASFHKEAAQKFHCPYALLLSVGDYGFEPQTLCL